MNVLIPLGSLGVSKWSNQKCLVYFYCKILIGLKSRKPAIVQCRKIPLRILTKFQLTSPHTYSNNSFRQHKEVLNIPKYKLSQHDCRPFNLHLDFWKSRSWKIKVCFETDLNFSRNQSDCNLRWPSWITQHAQHTFFRLIKQSR